MNENKMATKVKQKQYKNETKTENVTAIDVLFS